MFRRSCAADRSCLVRDGLVRYAPTARLCTHGIEHAAEGEAVVMGRESGYIHVTAVRSYYRYMRHGGNRQSARPKRSLLGDHGVLSRWRCVLEFFRYLDRLLVTFRGRFPCLRENRLQTSFLVGG